MTDEKTQVVVNLPKALVKRVDHLAVEWDCFRKDAVERLLVMALPLAEALTEKQEGT